MDHLHEIDNILNRLTFDIEILNETKLDESIPNSFFNHPKYVKLRLDRNRRGFLIFIKNGLQITKTQFSTNMELIYFQLKIKSVVYNFVYSYRSPNLNEDNYLEGLESYIHTLNLNAPLS